MKLNHIYGIDVEESLTHYDVIFTKVESVEKNSGIQGGLSNAKGDICVSIMRKGAFCFDPNNEPYASYWAEKLNIDKHSAQAIINIFLRK